MADRVDTTLPPQTDWMGQPTTDIFGNNVPTAGGDGVSITPSWSTAAPAQPQTVAAPSTAPPSVEVSDPGLTPSPGRASTNADTQVEPGLVPTPTGGLATTSTATPAPTGPTVTLTSKDFDKAFANVGQANPLNDFYNTTYHFRLFCAGDKDLNDQTNGEASGISKVAQVTIVESAVTGVGIRHTIIETTPAQNGNTRDQVGTVVSMTVVDPLGVSFLDNLIAAAKESGMTDYSKGQYYLELTFRGWDVNGNRMSTAGLPNGGIWVWTLQFNKIHVKVNEGGGVFDMTFVVIGTGAYGSNTQEELRTPQTSITASGKTVGEMFDDFVKQFNIQYQNEHGGTQKQPLVSLAAIVTHPIQLGSPTAVGKDPKNFSLIFKQPFNSSSRTWQFTDTKNNGIVTCQVPPGATISEFVQAVLKATEEGQTYMKDEKATGKVADTTSTVNERGFRESVLYSTQPLIKNVGFDTQSNSYIKQVTMHVVGFYTNRPILSDADVTSASNTDVQKKMLQNMIDKGIFKKKYEYIFTSLNTEVMNFNIECDLAWQAILPKLAGANSGYQAVANHAKIGSGNLNKQYFEPASQEQRTVTDQPTMTPTDQQTSSDTATPTSGTFTASDSSGLTSLVLPGPNVNTASTGAASSLTTTPLLSDSMIADLQKKLASSTPTTSTATQKLTNTSGLTTPEVNTGNGANVYIEDLVDQSIFNQNQPPRASHPISFKHTTTDTQNEKGGGTSEAYHRDQSIIGAIFAQIYGGDAVSEGFQSIELGIRGDPYWLGQTYYDIQTKLNSGKPIYDANGPPDWISVKQAFFLHFKYPLTVGPDFRPVISDSEAFNGMYEVYMVKNDFEEGKFSQTLKAVLLPLLDPRKATGSDPSKPNGGNGTNPSTTPVASTTPPTGSTPLTPKPTTDQQQANARTFKESLLAQAAAQGVSLTPAQADGIVANAYRESSMATGVAPYRDVNGPSGGLMAWHDVDGKAGGRLTAAQNYIGVPIQQATIEQQAAFTIHELNTTERGALTQLQSTTTAQDASQAWVKYYERPKDPSAGQATNLRYMPNLYGPGKGASS
jgi:hypothetical protein